MTEKPIIFIGTGRSGSTVISGAVFSHRDLGYPSNYQQKFPSFLGINLIRRVFDNRFWRVFTRGGRHNMLYKLIFLPSEAYNMWRHLTGPRINFSRGFLLEDRATPEEATAIRAYFTQMVALQGKKRLAFKITGPARIGYLLSIFPDAQFVYIKRRLVPTLNSFLKISFWETRGKYRLWFTGAYSAVEKQWAAAQKQATTLTAFQLGRINAMTQKEIAQHNANVFECDYEDFVKNPEMTLRLLLDFLQLHHDSDCYSYLDKNPIYDNSKSDAHYFNPAELEQIYKAYEKGCTIVEKSE